MATLIKKSSLFRNTVYQSTLCRKEKRDWFYQGLAEGRGARLCETECSGKRSAFSTSVLENEEKSNVSRSVMLEPTFFSSFFPPHPQKKDVEINKIQLNTVVKLFTT